jgi:hypothetical protein
MSEISLLEKKLAEEPITLPSSPFWDVFKRFGRDEMIAMAVNVAGTAGVNYALKHAGNLARNAKDVFLVAAGPVIEKFGFFPAHFKEALDVYRTTPDRERDKLTRYFVKAVKGGSKSLFEDVLVHDPLYIAMMYGGMQLYPETPAWLLSVASFIAAVFGVAALEVGCNELAYLRRKGKFKKAGFGQESYLESRFLISSEVDADSVVRQLSEKYNLGESKVWQYHDRYFVTNLPEYSGRTPKMRLRKRTRLDKEDKPVQTAQVTYTRAGEIAKKEIGQYRYFLTRKDKIYFLLGQDMPQSIDEIDDAKARRILIDALKNDKPHDVIFQRRVAYDPSGILVSADKVMQNRPFYLVELKAYNDTNLLKEAMRFVLMHFPVVMQTTHGKYELARINGEH